MPVPAGLYGELFTPDSPGYEAVRGPAWLRMPSPPTSRLSPGQASRSGLLLDFWGTARASPEVQIEGGLPHHLSKKSFHDLASREDVVAGVRIRSEFFLRPMRPSEDPATAYHGSNFPRLAAAKKTYDPERLFAFPQSI